MWPSASGRTIMEPHLGDKSLLSHLDSHGPRKKKKKKNLNSITEIASANTYRDTQIQTHRHTLSGHKHVHIQRRAQTCTHADTLTHAHTHTDERHWNGRKPFNSRQKSISNLELVLRRDTNRRADKGLFAPDKTSDRDTCPINWDLPDLPSGLLGGGVEWGGNGWLESEERVEGHIIWVTSDFNARGPDS